MRMTWSPRRPGDIEYGLIFGAIAVLALAAAAVLPVTELAPVCTFRSMTGLPCPACGSTRSLACLAHGQFLASAALNPLFVAAVSAALIAFLLNGVLILFRLPRPSLHMTTGEGICIRWLAALLVVAQWAFLILRS
jgi:hypothetical protein